MNFLEQNPIFFIFIVVFLIGLFFFILKKKKKKKPEEWIEKGVDARQTQLLREERHLKYEEEIKKIETDFGLEKTRAFFRSTFERLFQTPSIKDFYEILEESLLSADLGIDFTEHVLKKLKEKHAFQIPSSQDLKKSLKEILSEALPADPNFLDQIPHSKKPYTIFIVGVNGAGKTTTIGKLCQALKMKDQKVLVGAADTFRAAAVDQLKAWVDRTGVEGIFQKEGADPAAVAFDTLQAGRARQMDYCIIDTAGRLHTKQNLMEELKKMKRVLQKAAQSEESPQETWLVLDGSMGQNALFQAREFHEHLKLTGVIITKLDGSAKGGIVFAIVTELKVPIYFIGVGEQLGDLVPFEKEKFVQSILDDNRESGLV